MQFYAEKQQNNAKMDIAQPVSRETVDIFIDGKKVVRYKDEIEKEIYKYLQKPIYEYLMMGR